MKKLKNNISVTLHKKYPHLLAVAAWPSCLLLLCLWKEAVVNASLCNLQPSSPGCEITNVSIFLHFLGFPINSEHFLCAWETILLFYN